jgi:hypothetical protein
MIPQVLVKIQGDSLAKGPMEVYLQISNEFVNQLTDDELTTVYYQHDVQHVTLQMQAYEKLKFF